MITLVPNPVLTTPAKSVGKIDKKILDIIAHMKRALIDTRNPKGVGLAAPQIGISYRIFITRPRENSPIETFLNPEIIERSAQVSEIQRPKDSNRSPGKDKKLEGCLSIPYIWGYLKRPTRVKLRYMDITGKTQEREFHGFEATIIQHETDHINGILFTHRVLEQNEKLYTIEENEKGEEKLVEVYL